MVVSKGVLIVMFSNKYVLNVKHRVVAPTASVKFDMCACFADPINSSDVV